MQTYRDIYSAIQYNFAIPFMAETTESYWTTYKTMCNSGFFEFAYYSNLDGDKQIGPFQFDDVIAQFAYGQEQIRKFWDSCQIAAKLGANPLTIRLNWGDKPEIELRHQSEKIMGWISDRITDKKSAAYRDAISTQDDKARETYSALVEWSKQYRGVARLFQFAQSRESPEMLGYYESFAKYQLERRTIGKPGKVLRKAFPFMTDSDCEDFANWFKSELAPIEYQILQSKSGADIARVYQHENSRSIDFNCGLYRGMDIKSLVCSCMRHNFGSIHPATVYGSGDFKLIWAQDKAGKIAGRVLVYIAGGKYIPGPIYTLSDSATEALMACMQGEGFDLDSYVPDWAGAKLSAINIEGARYAMPYIDFNRTADKSDCGDYFILRGDRGDYVVKETQGYIYADGNDCVCEVCGDSMSADDSFYSPSGDCLCDHCYSSRYSVCEYCNETHDSDEMISVSVNQWRADCFCPRCADNAAVYSENMGEYIHVDSAVYIDCEGTYTANWEMDDYFFSDKSGEYFPNSELVTLSNGQNWAKSEAEESGDWIISENEKGGFTAILKPYLELNQFGRVINRQLELELA